MDKLFKMAEEEMMSLHHPYVGTEHFLLACLKSYPIDELSYEELYEYILKIVGRAYKKSQYILYTPILRDVKKMYKDKREAIKFILNNDDSLAYNILLNKGENIESILIKLLNSMD